MGYSLTAAAERQHNYRGHDHRATAVNDGEDGLEERQQQKGLEGSPHGAGNGGETQSLQLEQPGAPAVNYGARTEDGLEDLATTPVWSSVPHLLFAMPTTYS